MVINNDTHKHMHTYTHIKVLFLIFLTQEAYIADLDAKSGASLKLTILNPKGRIWTMVAGGGASVIYAYVLSLSYKLLPYILTS